MSRRPIDMPDLELIQLRYESETWKRLVAFMMDENVYLKFRLSEVLQNNFDECLLEQLENFQGSFLKQDDLISVIRNDLAGLDKLLGWELTGDVSARKEIDNKMKTIRNNVHCAEKQFSQLRSEFINYLSGNTQAT